MKHVRFSFRRLAATAALGPILIGLTGCVSSPTYVAPEPKQLPAAFDRTLPDTGRQEPVGPRWWEEFHDPVLNQLVTRCLKENYDLQQADARFHEARALWLAADSSRGPTVQAAVEYRRQHEPPLEKSKDPLVDQFFVSGFDATWEIDLFGRVRSIALAAQAGAEAQAAARCDVAVTLAAEVARNYFELRGVQAALAAGRETVELRGKQLELIRGRQALGAANQMEIETARQSLAGEQAHLNDVEAALTRAIHRLGVLTVQTDGVLTPMLANPTPWPVEPTSPAGVTPATMILGRADIRRAEREVLASSASQDTAKADLLPRLSFNGHFSFFAFGWGLGPQLSWDVFDRRRVRARQAVAGARADAALAVYQLAVITAVEEVENGFVKLSTARERREVLTSGRAAALAVVQATRRRMELGVATRIDLVDAELRAAAATRAVAIEEAAVREAWVAVFKALGGGGTNAMP